MDELDKKLFNDLSNKVDIPIRCEYIIRNALKNKRKKNKNIIKNTILTIVRVGGVIFLTSGIVFASAKIYENIWKEPEKVDNFYGGNSECDSNELYEIWHSKNINISTQDVISEDEARRKINEILNKFGYAEESIKLVNLIDNPSDDGMFYRAVTDNKFMIELDAKDTRNFKIFTNIAYDNIDKYRGTQEEIEETIESMCKKYGYDVSKYNHKEVKFNIAQSEFQEMLSKHTYIESTPDNANIWEVKYNKEYNGVINKYQEITFGIIPEINELYYFIYTDKAPENTDIVVDKEKAKQIALEKEKDLNLEYTINNIYINLDIVKINGNAYLRENNFEHYYESRMTPNFPIENIQYYRVQEKIRQVWRVKLEFEQKDDSKYNENSFTYFIDVSTGEIVGGE